MGLAGPRVPPARWLAAPHKSGPVRQEPRARPPLQGVAAEVEAAGVAVCDVSRGHGPARNLTVTNTSEGSFFVVRHHRDFVEIASLQLGEEVWRIHFGLLVRPNLLPAGEQLLRIQSRGGSWPTPDRFSSALVKPRCPKESGRVSDDWRKRIKRWSIRHFIPGAVWFNSFVPSENSEQRKLAAIMFTDMVGYSALSQRDDKLALELLEEHREL